MKEYKIEQFPKNKVITKLSKEQKEIRGNKKKYIYLDLKRCNTCMNELSIDEYYIKDSKTGRRANRCRDCELKRQGVLEIGKLRYALKVADKGFRRCSICRDTKPLNKFSKNKGQYLGYSNNCYKCQSNLTLPWRKKQAEDITDWYIINYYGKNLGYNQFNDELIIKLRNEVLEKRKPKHKFENKEFQSTRKLANYINKKYNIGIHTIEDRIRRGFTEYECTMTRLQFVRHNKAKEVQND